MRVPLRNGKIKYCNPFPEHPSNSNQGNGLVIPILAMEFWESLFACAAETPFIKMVEEKIFKPLHMENSFFVVPEHKLKDLAQGIGGGPFGDEALDLDRPQHEHRGRGYKVPNGGIYSTPTDLGKFLMSNMGIPNMLETKHLESMHANQTPETGYHSYGLGFELYRDPVITIVGHSGGVPGYSAYAGFEKEHGYGVLLMRNYNWGTTNWDFDPKILLRKLVDLEKNRFSRT